MSSDSINSSGKFRFSIDRGGTFTDVYAELPDGNFKVIKLLSKDPNNYKDAPREGIRRIMRDYYKENNECFACSDDKKDIKIPTNNIQWIRMGTTVATNALLEREGYPFVFLTTKGLKDVLQIGNQSRSFIFDLQMRKVPPLYEHVIEVNERVRIIKNQQKTSQNQQEEEEQQIPKGLYPNSIIKKTITGDYIEIIEKLDEEKVKNELKSYYDRGFRCLSVALIHSYCFPDHEKRIGEIGKEIGFEQISLSSEIMPMIRLVPRGQTSCVDAYLTPLITEYLKGFVSGFDEKMKENTQVSFMMSDGGLCPMENFHGYRSILSGPAGGVVGYGITSFNKKKKIPIIGFDMGGTSTDVSRYDGKFNHVYDTETAGVIIQAPQLDIHTVAAGGGSKLQFKAGMMQVGPESVGAHPGPVCYRKGGKIPSVTDANVVLGRIQAEYFPHIFGDDEKQPLDKEGSIKSIKQLTDQINEYNKQNSSSDEEFKPKTYIEIANGYIELANEAMCRPIRNITEAKGFSAKNHILSCFGGAGPQHACSIARRLGMKKIFIHRFSGILSAYGLGLADIVYEKQEASSFKLTNKILEKEIPKRFKKLEKKIRKYFYEKNFSDENIKIETYLNLRYNKTDTSLMIETPNDGNYKFVFENEYLREFGFKISNQFILIDDIRVRGIGKTNSIQYNQIHSLDDKNQENLLPNSIQSHKIYFNNQFYDTNVYYLHDFKKKSILHGPAMILNNTSTIIIEPNCIGKITKFGDLKIEIDVLNFDQQNVLDQISIDKVDNTTLAVFSHRFMSIAEQMGRTLQRTSISTNIKERLDFSCALFGPDGGLVANAPHLPVHLGSMQSAVKWQIDFLGSSWKEGDVIVTNHPSAGGSHLPDITVITPVFSNGSAVFFVASRGHHADIGGISPGSMPPFSHFLYEEGACIKSFKLRENGIFQEEGITEILKNPIKVHHENEKQLKNKKNISGTRNLSDNLSDLKAQIAANEKGIFLVKELIDEFGLDIVHAYMNFVQIQAEEAVRQMLCEISLKRNLNEIDSIVSSDFMDDGSIISLKLTINRKSRTAIFDFTGTSVETFGNFNAPTSITYSAIIYSLRCLVSEDIPLNQGCLNPIEIILPEGSLLSPSDDAAVVGGNVLTSQRITDVILEAFGECACSQGCMNNFTFGSDKYGGYYETIAGGAGAGPFWHGVSGVHSHMTNTRITDAEIFEYRYPVLLREFSIRKNSGGKGKFNGGDGVVREIEFLDDISVAILSERRSFCPRGMNGGHDAERGQNFYLKCLNQDSHEYRIINLGGKNELDVLKFDRIKILTPGGGGYGKVED